MKVSNSLSGAIRKFSYWVANGTVGHPLLEGINYVDGMKEEPSFIEAAYAIFINNIEMDGKGTVLNYKYAEKRAAQYIKRYYDASYVVEPPFDYWETELYEI